MSLEAGRRQCWAAREGPRRLRQKRAGAWPREQALLWEQEKRTEGRKELYFKPQPDLYRFSSAPRHLLSSFHHHLSAFSPLLPLPPPFTLVITILLSVAMSFLSVFFSQVNLRSS